MVSTLDFESSDPGSNPGRTSVFYPVVLSQCCCVEYKFIEDMALLVLTPVSFVCRSVVVRFSEVYKVIEEEEKCAISHGLMV